MLTVGDLKESLWYKGHLAHKLDSLQQKIKTTIDESNEPLICVLSSRQIGKSYLILAIALEFCLKNPGKIVRILANTLKQVSDIVQDNLAPLTLDAPEGLIERHKSDYRWRIGDSSLRIGSLERAHIDNNRGGNASLVIYEEGGFVDSEDYRYAVQSVIGPQLIRSDGREIHITSPSEDEYHYIHTEVVPRAESKGTLFRYTVYDSPSISERQIEEAARRCGGKGTEAFRREYLAEIVRSQSLMVVPEFDEALHVKAFDLPEYYKGLIAIDLGGTKDKTHACLMANDFENDCLLIVNEFMYDENTKSSIIIDHAKRMERELQWEGTPERWVDLHGATQIDWGLEFDYPVRVPEKIDRDGALNMLRVRFTRRKILIHPRCVHLIGCLKTARYDSKRKDFVRTDIYGHADPVMSLVYGNRMIDKMSNPFPKETIRRDYQMQVGYRTEKDNLDILSETLVPYNPLRSKSKFG